MTEYIADFVYGATKYPCALFRPTVFLGRFKYSTHDEIQQKVFQMLLNAGFKRTFWQLVFPGQVAGLIKRIPPTTDGINEYHVRFYQDGTIECELEIDRWSLGHWTGLRYHQEKGENLLKNILEEILSNTPSDLKTKAMKLIGSKNFTNTCIRERGK